MTIKNDDLAKFSGGDIMVIPSGNQTWLAGKSPMNEAFNGKIIFFFPRLGCYNALENHDLNWVNQLKIAMFNRSFDITKRQVVSKWGCNPLEPTYKWDDHG